MFMLTTPKGVRWFFLAVVMAVLGACVLVLGLSAVPRYRWRVQLAWLKSTGAVQDITWKELWHLSRHGDPFDLKELVNTHSPYPAIKNPFSSREDLAEGAKTFQANCTQCHGTDGAGGAGPALKLHSLRRGDSDWALFKTISNGIPGTAMPKSTLPEYDRWQLVGYVKALSAGSGGPAAPAKPSRVASVAPVRYEDLLAAGRDTQRWLTYSGTYDSQRFSANDQIKTTNVSNLRLLWMRQYTTSETLIETSPLVVDGIMFVTVPPNRVEALDAKTGALIWSYDHELPQHLSLCCGYVNRGLAVLGQAVFFGTLDAHLIALDMKTGGVLWDEAIADSKAAYSITSAPLALKNMVITGVAGGEYGIRGFIDAREATTGKLVWKFDAVPQPGQPGSETWDLAALKTAGGPTWLTGTFDPELNDIYWPVGNPSPNYDGDSRKGDNLYTNSVVALDADQGKLRWYFQFTPHDVFDWDATEILVSFDANVEGRHERLLGQANRNAFYYVLDRETGKLRVARAIVKQTWAKEIDAGGRPVRNVDAVPTPQGSAVFPSVGGATNWMSPSYSPLTGLMYVPVREWGGIFYSKPGAYQQGELFTGGSSRIFNDPAPKGMVRAIEALTGEVKWEYANNPTSTVGGLLSTKGGVVFGSAGTAFVALDAKSGHELWRVDTGGWVKAGPVTYSIDGKQMVTVAAGHDLLTFGL
jgi:alcohol dehydrogenase (cytochrome c)